MLHYWTHVLMGAHHTSLWLMSGEERGLALQVLCQVLQQMPVQPVCLQ